MWVLYGPFDGQVQGDVNFEKPKLLKSNTAYTAGRKDKPLLINNKKISHDHCDFVVGAHSVDDVTDPTKKPPVQLVNWNKKDKALLIVRNEKEVHAPPSTDTPLEDGDTVHLITGVSVTIRWVPMCIYMTTNRGKSSVSVDACASLGIKLVHAPSPQVTHHIIPSYTADLASSASLLCLSHFVKPEWLSEVFRLGALPRDDPSSLEFHFSPPPETKFRPTFSPSLDPAHKKFGVWQPNEERANFLASSRFICLSEKRTSESTLLEETIECGGGMFERFEVGQGKEKFRKAVVRSKSKQGKKTVLIADEEAMKAAVGQDGWDDLVAVAKSAALRIHPASKLIEAILNTDLEPLFASQGRTEAMDVDSHVQESAAITQTPAPVPQSSLFSEGPGESQPEQSQGGRRKLVRRATASRAGSREPSVPPPAPMPVAGPSAVEKRENDVEEDVKPKKKLLTRRAKPVITGFDDPSAVINAADLPPKRYKTPPPQDDVIDLAAPTPNRPTKLKRRFGAVKESSTSETNQSGIEETYREPPLKKFRALFEASNQEGSQTQTQSGSGDAETQAVASGSGLRSRSGSGLQSTVGAGPLRMGNSSLAILREEEEETQSMLLTGRPTSSFGDDSQNQNPNQSQRGTKRSRLEAMRSEDDVEMIVADEMASEDARGTDATGDDTRTSKRRAVDGLNAVQRAGSSDSSDPTTSNKPGRPKPTGLISPSKNSNRGAPMNGAPDRDEAFLKAIASTSKKGKAGKEDEFDREFNKLKIAKPSKSKGGADVEYDDLIIGADGKTAAERERDRRREREREEEEEQWARVLQEFGNDGNLRGNFMVVLEMEVFRKPGQGGGGERVKEVDSRWVGRPNFKKFKKKTTGEPRTFIPLVAVSATGSMTAEEYEIQLAAQAQMERDRRRGAHQKQNQPRNRKQTKAQKENRNLNLKQNPDDSEEDDDDDFIDRSAFAADMSIGNGKLPAQFNVPLQRAGRGDPDFDKEDDRDNRDREEDDGDSQFPPIQIGPSQSQIMGRPSGRAPAAWTKPQAVAGGSKAKPKAKGMKPGGTDPDFDAIEEDEDEDGDEDELSMLPPKRGKTTRASSRAGSVVPSSSMASTAGATRGTRGSNRASRAGSVGLEESQMHSQFQSQMQMQSQRPTRGAAKGRTSSSKSLFLDSEDESVVTSTTATKTRGTAPSKASGKGKRKIDEMDDYDFGDDIVDEDDDDDEVVFVEDTQSRATQGRSRSVRGTQARSQARSVKLEDDEEELESFDARDLVDQEETLHSSAEVTRKPAPPPPPKTRGKVNAKAETTAPGKKPKVHVVDSDDDLAFDGF